DEIENGHHDNYCNHSSYGLPWESCQSFYPIEWDIVQFGDEFTNICQQGVLAMSNATKYIIFGQLIDFTIEQQRQEQEQGQEQEQKPEQGQDQEQKQNKIKNKNKSKQKTKEKQLLDCLFVYFASGLCKQCKKKLIIRKQRKQGQAEEQIALFMAMTDKAYKSIRSLTVTHAFDQLITFPVLPNLVHLALSHVKINACFKSINIKEMMPQLKTLDIENISTTTRDYCNWKKLLEVDMDDEAAFSLIQCSTSTHIPQNEKYFEIEFVNHLLRSCPNLLAFRYAFINAPTRTIEVPSTRVIEIPPTLEWVIMEQTNDTFWNSETYLQIDLSRCKRISGLQLSLLSFLIFLYIAKKIIIMYFYIIEIYLI
ncbi:hypothetical protein RFI_26581, partial [Reticulomyxa filosa]